MTYVILSFVAFSRQTSAEMKNDRQVGCAVSVRLSKHAKPYDKLRISLSEAPILIEPTARPLYFILIQPKRYFCDKIKLSDSCR